MGTTNIISRLSAVWAGFCQVLPWFGGFEFMLQPPGLINGNKQALGNATSLSDMLPFPRPTASLAAQLSSAAGGANREVGWKLRTRHW